MALENLYGYDLLAITRHQHVGILRTSRATFPGSPERGKQFDALCDGLMDWLEFEIALLRFARMQ
jgi:hypothetical protein